MKEGRDDQGEQCLKEEKEREQCQKEEKKGWYTWRKENKTRNKKDKQTTRNRKGRINRVVNIRGKKKEES